MWWSSGWQIWLQLKFTSVQSAMAAIIQLATHGKVDNKDSKQDGLIVAKPGAKAYSLNLQSPLYFGKGLISHDWKVPVAMCMYLSHSPQ